MALSPAGKPRGRAGPLRKPFVVPKQAKEPSWWQRLMARRAEKKVVKQPAETPAESKKRRTDAMLEAELRRRQAETAEERQKAADRERRAGNALKLKFYRDACNIKGFDPEKTFLKYCPGLETNPRFTELEVGVKFELKAKRIPFSGTIYYASLIAALLGTEQPNLARLQADIVRRHEKISKNPRKK